jgi:hypothetical protein
MFAWMLSAVPSVVHAAALPIPHVVPATRILGLDAELVLIQDEDMTKKEQEGGVFKS